VPEFITPTIGFASETIEHGRYHIKIFDLGGGANIRNIWPSYYAEVCFYFIIYFFLLFYFLFVFHFSLFFIIYFFFVILFYVYFIIFIFHYCYLFYLFTYKDL
jgi:ADP-ribosylation factor family